MTETTTAPVSALSLSLARAVPVPEVLDEDDLLTTAHADGYNEGRQAVLTAARTLRETNPLAGVLTSEQRDLLVQVLNREHRQVSAQHLNAKRLAEAGYEIDPAPLLAQVNLIGSTARALGLHRD